MKNILCKDCWYSLYITIRRFFTIDDIKKADLLIKCIKNTTHQHRK